MAVTSHGEVDDNESESIPIKVAILGIAPSSNEKITRRTTTSERTKFLQEVESFR